MCDMLLTYVPFSLGCLSAELGMLLANHEKFYYNEVMKANPHLSPKRPKGEKSGRMIFLEDEE